MRSLVGIEDYESIDVKQRLNRYHDTIFCLKYNNYTCLIQLDLYIQGVGKSYTKRVVT